MSLFDDAGSPSAGHNEPPIDGFDEALLDELANENRQLVLDAQALLERARDVPKVIETDAEMSSAMKLVLDMRDNVKAIKAAHSNAKAPVLKRAGTIDGFFFGWWEKVVRRKRGDKPGAADIVQARIDDRQQRKLAEEKLRRDREAREAAERERVAQEAKAKAEREAEEARLAAERARAPARVEEKRDVAAQKADAADAAHVETLVASDQAEAAQIATQASPAQMARTRTDEGMATMAREPYAEVTDYAKINLDLIRPYLKREAIEAAVRMFARTTGHTVPLEGANIGFRPKTVIRR